MAKRGFRGAGGPVMLSSGGRGLVGYVGYVGYAHFTHRHGEPAPSQLLRQQLTAHPEKTPRQDNVSRPK